MIIDAWGRNASIELPNVNSSLMYSKEITIDSSPAFITNVTTNVPSGEYGAGHNIEINFHFSRQVRLFSST